MADPKVYKLWQDGNSVGIFQFESQGMTNFMKDLKPDCLEDIIAGVSLYRPGPMDQIPRYILNKKDPDNAIYTHPSLKPILNVTYGCMVYQEQVMQIVRDLAGYSLGRADLVRRAMGKKKLEVMNKERENFVHGLTDENGNIEIKGCVRNGIDEESANKIFDEMAEFAKYAFNKSHAACYAVIAYQTAYLKAYFPAEFMAAMLNSFLGNLDKVPIYINECKRLNIPILKPDINKSLTKFSVENNQIRFGLGSVKNVGINAIENIVRERKENGEYVDFTDFCERIYGEQVNKKCIESLIKSGAMDNFGKTRATLLASFEKIIDTIADSNNRSFKNQISMFEIANSEEDIQQMKYDFNEKEEFAEKELLSMEKEMLGIYISGHPLEKYKEQIERISSINTMMLQEANEQLQTNGECNIKDNSSVKIVGVITRIKKKYTKSNKIMAFVTIEDLYGSCEVIVFESCYLLSSKLLYEESIVKIDGRISVREDQDITIIASAINDINNVKAENSESSNGGYTDNPNEIYSTNTIQVPRKKIEINITDFEEEKKVKLRGIIKFFSGDRNNLPIFVRVGEKVMSSGAIFANNDTIKEFEEIVGKENVTLE